MRVSSIIAYCSSRISFNELLFSLINWRDDYILNILQVIWSKCDHFGLSYGAFCVTSYFLTCDWKATVCQWSLAIGKKPILLNPRDRCIISFWTPFLKNKIYIHVLGLRKFRDRGNKNKCQNLILIFFSEGKKLGSLVP